MRLRKLIWDKYPAVEAQLVAEAHATIEGGNEIYRQRQLEKSNPQPPSVALYHNGRRVC